MADVTHSFDFAKAQAENLAHIQRMQDEARNFVAERHRLMAEEAERLRGQDRAPWQYAVGGMAAGAALVGATAAFIKIFG